MLFTENRYHIASIFQSGATKKYSMFFQTVENLQIQNQQNHQNQLHIQAVYTIYCVNPGKLFSLSLSLISKMKIIVPSS